MPVIALPNWLRVVCNESLDIGHDCPAFNCDRWTQRCPLQQLDAISPQLRRKFLRRFCIHHLVTGVDVSRQAVEDAVRLSEEKYCSVGAMVKLSAELRTTVEVVPISQAELIPV